MRDEKVQKLYHSITQVDNEYIEEAECYKGIKRKRIHFKVWAACLALAVFCAVLYQVFYPQKVLDRAALNLAEASYITFQMGNRVTSYKEISTDSDKLKKNVGKVYRQEENGAWYYLKGVDYQKQLIHQDKDGGLSLYEFDSFVADGVSERKDGKKRGGEEWYPDAELTPYTYGEVMEKIYNVDSAEEIENITVGPYDTRFNLDSNEKQIQKEIGTQTYTNPKDISVIYEIVAGVLSYGEEDNDDVKTEGLKRYSYSFSSNTEYSWFYAQRSITVTLKDGSTIDSWMYDAQQGRLYQRRDIYTDPLSEENVYRLNEIFGIE